MQQLGLGASETTTTQAKWIADKRMVRPEQLPTFVKWASTAPELVLDYEATGIDTRRGAKTFMAGFYEPAKGAKVLDLRLLEHGEQALKDAVKNRTGVTIVHNGKMEVSHSRAMGFEIGGTLWDNQMAAFAMDELLDSHGQKELVESQLKRQPVMAKMVHDWMQTNLGTYKRGHEFNPNELEVPYNCEDVTDAWDLYQHFKPKVEKQGLTQLVRTDSELNRAVSEMECRGLALDMGKAESLAARFTGELKELYKTIRECVGRDFDVASHQQLFGILYGQLGLPMHADLEKKGKLDDNVLAWMMTLPEVTSDPKKSTLVDGIREWRERDKLHGTYLLPWLYEHQIGGYLYPNLNMIGARTRRFSADSPNLQNVPIRTELGQLVRSCIIAREGWTTYSMDYSQVEYRNFVHYCGEPALVMGYKTDPLFDIHALVGQLCGVTRKDGKHLNFGLLYGMGVDKLARALLISKEAAKKLLEVYYSKIPSIKVLKRKLEQEVRAKGYVRDVFGGRRHLKVEESYKSLNSLCQMTAANIIRRAIVRAYPIIKGGGGNVLLQIHDDLKFELPGRDVREHLPTLRLIKEVMEDNKEFRVPITTAVERYTTNWNEKEPVSLAA